MRIIPLTITDINEFDFYQYKKHCKNMRYTTVLNLQIRYLAVSLTLVSLITVTFIVPG